MRVLARLSARFVASCTENGRHADGGGLYLSVDGSRKRWVLFYKFAGRQREMGLGGAATVSLADARRKAEAARRLLAEGIDPLEAKRQGERLISIPTFGAIADQHITAMEPSWRNPKHVAQWRMTLSQVRDGQGNLTEDGYCLSIRNTPVNLIDTAAVLQVLRPIWNKLPETAGRLRGRIEAVLDVAKVAGHREGPNPAAWKGHLALILPARKKLSRGHHAAMPFADVPAFIRKLRITRGIGAFCLEFAILTAARSGEVRLARWSEFDLQARLWTVPARRMKAGREHRVPLSDRAVEILQTVSVLPRIGENDPLVFPGTRKGKPLSDATFKATMRRLDAGAFTAHGFRSAFRDWAGDATEFQREVAEAALAHAIGNATEAAYRRGDALEKRRELLDAWATYLNTKGK